MVQNLYTQAQRQSFWGSLTSKSPKTLMEKKIVDIDNAIRDIALRSEEHTSELQSH